MGFYDGDKTVSSGQGDSGDSSLGSNVDPLVKRIRDELKDSEESSRRDWVEEVKLCRRFVAGDQWPAEDQEILNQQKKPQITFNRAAPLIEVVVGTEVQHRRRMIFQPQDPNWNTGAAVSDLATHSVDWALEGARAPHRRSRIFRDCVIGGLAWGHYYVDLVIDPDGRVAVDRVDPLEMRWDPNSRDVNMTDARWVARKRRWSRNEILDEFGIDVGAGSESNSDVFSDQLSDSDSGPHNIVQHHPDPWREGSQEIQGDDSEPNTLRYNRKLHWVTEHQSYELEKYVRVRVGDLAPPPPMEPPGGGAGVTPLQGMAAGMGGPPQSPGGPAASPPAAMAPPPGGGLPPSPDGGMPPMGNPAGAPPPGGSPPGPDMPQGPGGPPSAGPPGGPPAGGPPPVPPFDALPEEQGEDHPPDPDRWMSYSLDEYDDLLADRDEQGLEPPQAITLMRRAYRQAFICKDKVLRDEPMFVDSFSYLAMTCKWDDEKRIWYGLMRPLIDPQRAANKWLSQGIHHFNSGAKGVLLIEQGIVVNPKGLQTDWTKPNSVILFKADMLAQERFKVVEPAPFPEAAASIMQWSVGAMRDVAGVNVELAGASEGDESSVTVQKRQSQGMTILAPVFDALDQYREAEALLTLKLVKEFLTNGRMIRIAGPYPAKDKHIALLKEDFAESYDLRLDDVPRDPNQKMAVFEALQPLMPMWERMGGIPDPIKDFFPLPASTIQEWKQWEAEKRNAPQQPPDRDHNPDFIKAEIAYKNSQAELMSARAKAITQEMQIKVMQVAQEMDNAGKDRQLEKTKLAIDAGHKDRELNMDEGSGSLDAIESIDRLLSPTYPGE